MMTMTEEVDSFAQMFAGPPGETQRASRQARAKRERRTQLTAKQRKRNAVRTAQINFRCSPKFKDLVAGLAKHLDCSIADVLEEAADLLAEKKGYGGKHG
jgi:hypothetical protein